MGERGIEIHNGNIVLPDVGTGGLSLSITHSVDVATAAGLSIFPSISGVLTINNYWGAWIYMGDPGAGNAVYNMSALALGMNVDNPPTDSCFIRAYNHSGAGKRVSYVLYMPDAVGSDYLLKWDSQIEPVESGGSGDITFADGWMKIKIGVGAVDYYLVASQNPS